ncbi:hypothetical protein K7X08_032773 [Anisodus acutangulus]|uniref:Uncharacterized protein n=1 Tax=Anisodus acutangulus TaxID=402998 RepID=A0A9Q1M306_9SOLA|nr:hypothetical protein K7X08_032773 [Anisodus acutangulus]
MDAISGMEFDFVASGHYTKIVHTSTEQLDEPSVLKLSKDMDEVRMLAKSFNLPNQDRKDSQGICFLGKRVEIILETTVAFGSILLANAKVYVFLEGPGICGYELFLNICTSCGLNWYVVEKDISNIVVYVSRNYFSVNKKRRLFHVGSLKWLSGLRPRQISELQCKPLVAVKNKIQQKICSKGHFLGLNRDESLGKNQGGLQTQQTDVPYAYQPQCNISHWV